MHRLVEEPRVDGAEVGDDLRTTERIHRRGEWLQDRPAELERNRCQRVTGGLALSDSLIQQFVGKGLIGRLSSRFGEGAVNGILTARIGLAALDLCRPLPFLTRNKPTLADFMREIVSFDTEKA